MRLSLRATLALASLTTLPVLGCSAGEPKPAEAAAPAASVGAAAPNEKGGSDDFGPYQVVEGWLKPV